jgi:hypothetical protein
VKKLDSPLRPDLSKIDASYRRVQKDWNLIDDQLDQLKIGRKDTRFDKVIRGRMMSAYGFLDHVLKLRVEPFSMDSLSFMLELNHRVHYGTDSELRAEYSTAIHCAERKFHRNVLVLLKWHDKHLAKGDHPLKVAAEMYVGIIGQPQLYIEGNHRTGSLIASWINLFHGYPPFVLSPDNAISYFAPSSEIKAFADKTTWRGMSKLPKYKKSFRTLWERLIDPDYIAS